MVTRKGKMTILYFGPIAAKGQPALGGYEAANRKNIEELRRQGLQVIEYPNPIINRKLGMLGKLAYLKLFQLPLGLYKYKGKKDVIMHITPLYRNLACPAVFTEWMAQKLSIPVVLDLRAGSFIDIYNNNGARQRRLMDKMLRLSTHVTVEGTSYTKDIRRVSGYKGRIDYFPNIVDCSMLKYQERTGGAMINLFYFGRITLSKGVDIILKIINLLDNNYHLYLAGNIAPDVDKNTLVGNGKITYLGKLSPAQLREQMKEMHIFLFPTRHPGEGQSNSLIEAMSEGLIPVTSDQGFCREVVADCGKVLPQGCNAEDYVAAIRDIVSGDMQTQGKMCIKHITECHNLKIEIAKLIKIYNEICNH